LKFKINFIFHFSFKKKFFFSFSFSFFSFRFSRVLGKATPAESLATFPNEPGTACVVVADHELYLVSNKGETELFFSSFFFSLSKLHFFFFFLTC